MDDADLKRIHSLSEGGGEADEDVEVDVEEKAPSASETTSSRVTIPAELETSPWADSPALPSKEPKEPPKKQPTTTTTSELSQSQMETYFTRLPKRSLDALQKSIKIADSCMDPHLSSRLFVDILSAYVVQYDMGNPAVALKYIVGLVDLAVGNLRAIRASGAIGTNVTNATNVVTSTNATIPSSGVSGDTKGNMGYIVSPQTPQSNDLEKIERYFLSTLEHIVALKSKPNDDDDGHEGAEGNNMDGSGRWDDVDVDDVLNEVGQWVVQHHTKQ